MFFYYSIAGCDNKKQLNTSYWFYVLYDFMVIRKLRQKKILNAKVISLFILLSVWTYFLITLFINIVDRFNQTPQENMLYTLWATLTLSGTLVVDNNFPNYTHSVITSDGNKIWLKSTTINLNTYTHKHITFVGTVKKYFKIIPVVEITTIKLADQSLVLSNNSYFFVDDLIYLDFSTQPQLSAIKSGADILVLFNESSVVSIERFACSKILKTRDCTYLITNYIQSNKDNFESYRAYTFYRHSTWFWTTFDANTYGFLFKNISDDMVLDVSNMFRIVNKQFVVDYHMDAIESNCKDAFSHLSTLDPAEWSVTYFDQSLLALVVKWIDNKKNPATCRITFDMWNNWEISHVEYNDVAVQVQ